MPYHTLSTRYLSPNLGECIDVFTNVQFAIQGFEIPCYLDHGGVIEPYEHFRY